MNAHLIAARTDKALETWEPPTMQDMRCATCALYWACMEGDCLMKSGCCSQWRVWHETT